MPTIHAPAPSELLRIFESPVKSYVKLGFGGAHTDSNQRLMYTSA
jgi:hypothetical protein